MSDLLLMYSDSRQLGAPKMVVKMNFLRGVVTKNQVNWNRGWIVLNFFFVLNKRLLFLFSLLCVFLYSESPAHILMYKGSVGDVRRGRGEVIIPKIPNFRKKITFLPSLVQKGGGVIILKF